MTSRPNTKCNCELCTGSRMLRDLLTEYGVDYKKEGKRISSIINNLIRFGEKCGREDEACDRLGGIENYIKECETKRREATS